MTKAQSAFLAVQKRQSEKRTAYAELRAVETPTDEQRSQLGTINTELTNIETDYRAAIDALTSEQAVSSVHAEDSEARERRDLCTRANVGDVLTAALEKRSTDGATSEAQAAFNLAPNMIPLDMLRAPVEHRGVTPGPTNTGATEAEVVTPVFASGAGAFLGIDRPVVDMGAAVYPVLTSRPTVGGPHSGSDDVGDTTGAYDADLLAPERIQASFIYRRTDAMRFGSMDSSLRMALNEGLQEKLDFESVGGTKGLLAGTNLPNNNVSAVTTFALYLSGLMYGRVDGRYATAKSDLRILMGQSTYAHAGSVYQSTAYKSSLAVLEDESGGVRVSAHVPAVASHKQNVVIRLGMRRDMVQPTWAGVTIIVDEVSLSGKGEIEVTAMLGINTKILRAGGFYKQQTQHQ